MQDARQPNILQGSCVQVKTKCATFLLLRVVSGVSGVIG